MDYLNLIKISNASKECTWFIKNYKRYLIKTNNIEGGLNLIFFNKLDNNLIYICTLKHIRQNLFKFISDYEVLINVE